MTTTDDRTEDLKDWYGEDDLPKYSDIPGRNIVVTIGSDVKMLPIRWWEEGLVQAAAINLLAGREGQGKSTVAASWVARETLAGGTVLWIGTEESREHAQAPRLTAAGADMDRVIFVDVKTVDAVSNLGGLHFPLDLPGIEKIIAEYGVTMMVLDPCKGLVPSDFRGNDDVAVRQYLEPIAALCSRQDIVLVGIMHFGKRESTDTGKLILGSVAWSQVARSVISIAEDPESETRVITNTKNNFTAEPRSLEFRIVNREVETQEGTSVLGAVEWIGETHKDARDLLGEQQRVEVEEFDDRDYTGEFKDSWLYRYLTDAHKAKVDIRPKDAVAYGADKGISRSSVFRLFEKLANAQLVESVDVGGFPKVSHWKIRAETTGLDTQGRETTETTGPDLRKQGETTADLFDPSETTEKTPFEQGKQDNRSPVVPVVSPNPRDKGPAVPPGAVTPSTPGQTDRVAAALANAKKTVEAAK